MQKCPPEILNFKNKTVNPLYIKASAVLVLSLHTSNILCTKILGCDTCTSTQDIFRISLSCFSLLSIPWSSTLNTSAEFLLTCGYRRDMLPPRLSTKVFLWTTRLASGFRDTKICQEQYTLGSNFFISLYAWRGAVQNDLLGYIFAGWFQQCANLAHRRGKSLLGGGSTL